MLGSRQPCGWLRLASSRQLSEIGQESASSRQLSGWLRRVFLLVIKETALAAHRVSRERGPTVYFATSPVHRVDAKEPNFRRPPSGFNRKLKTHLVQKQPHLALPKIFRMVSAIYTVRAGAHLENRGRVSIGRLKHRLLAELLVLD